MEDTIDENTVFLRLKKKQDTLIKFCDDKECEVKMVIEIDKVPYLPKRWKCYLHEERKQEKEREEGEGKLITLNQENHPYELNQYKQPFNEDNSNKLVNTIENHLRKLKIKEENKDWYHSNMSDNLEVDEDDLELDENNLIFNEKEISVRKDSDDGSNKSDRSSKKTEDLFGSDNELQYRKNIFNLNNTKEKSNRLDTLIQNKLENQMLFLSKSSSKKIRQFIRTFDFSKKDDGDLFIYASEYHSKYEQYFLLGDQLNINNENAFNLILCPIIKKLINTNNQNQPIQLNELVKIKCIRKKLLLSLVQLELATYIDNIVEPREICLGCNSSHLYWFHCSKQDVTCRYDFYQLKDDIEYPGYNLIMKVIEKWRMFINEINKLI